MADSFSKKETSLPEKQQQTPQASNDVTQAIGVGGLIATPHTHPPQHRQNETIASEESSMTPPPAKLGIRRSSAPLPAKFVVPTQIPKGSSSAPPPQPRQNGSAIIGGSSSTTPSKQYAIGGGSTSTRENVPNASVVQMIGSCGGIVSAIEQGNVAAGQIKKRRKPAQMAVPEGVIPTCCVCFRSFKSWKALFGHMRCHPDRQWRGCFPPPIEERLDAALNALNSVNAQGVAQGL